MARPIKETPILFGEDAKRFPASMQNVKPASQQEKQRVKAAYEKLKKNSNVYDVTSLMRLIKIEDTENIKPFNCGNDDLNGFCWKTPAFTERS